jgi:hypothetical protein
MRRAWSLALFLAMVPAIGFAQTIKVPEKVAVPAYGRSVQLTVEIDGSDFAYQTRGDLEVYRQWTSDPKQVVLRVTLFSGDKGELTFVTCKAVTADDKSSAAKLSQFYNCTVVKGDGPPGPTPPVDPTFPPGTYNLATVVYQAAKDVKSETRVAEAAALLKASKSVRDALAGVYTTPQEFLTEVKKVNNEALGDARDAWLPFFMKLNAQLTSLGKAGKLPLDANNIPLDWKDKFRGAWDEIILGLAAVK